MSSGFLTGRDWHQYSKYVEQEHPRAKDGKWAKKGEEGQTELSDDEKLARDIFVNGGRPNPEVFSRGTLDHFWAYKVDEKLQDFPKDKAETIRTAFAKVLKGYTDTAIKRFTANVAELNVFETMDELSESDPVIKKMLGPEGKVGGFYKTDPREPFSLNIDGGIDTGEKWGNSGTGTAESIYAHEFTHAVDGVGNDVFSDYPCLSCTGLWFRAASEEINRPDTPLSNYARSSPAEAFAEFGRLIHDKGRDYARVKFPKCYEVWELFGL